MPLCSLEQLRVISISILSHLCESSGFFQCSFFPGCLVKLHIGVLGSWWPANLSVIVILHAESPFTAVCSFQCHHPSTFLPNPTRQTLSFILHSHQFQPFYYSYLCSEVEKKIKTESVTSILTLRTTGFAAECCRWPSDERPGKGRHTQSLANTLLARSALSA